FLLDLLAQAPTEGDQVRICAILERIGPPAVAGVPKLIQCLKEPSEGVREAAARALGGVGAGAAPAIPELVNLLGEDSAAVRKEAATALRSIDPLWAKSPAARQAMPLLIKGLAD